MGKAKTVILTIIAVLVIEVIAVYSFDINLFGKDSSKKATSAAELVELSMDTESITTNLASPNNYAVVQFNILLDSKEAKQELELRTPEVKEAIISSVASFTKDELLGEEGIQKLIAELNSRLSNVIDSGEIERILVTEYKLQ